VSCRLPLAIAVAVASAILSAGCGGTEGRDDEGKTTIVADGSNTMVNVAQAWAEDYHKRKPQINVQVLGGGSGVGIASLINGTCDLANASRKMKEKEIARVKAKHGVEPKEFIVGYDALAVYVHKDHPLGTISLEQLAGIYGDGGAIEDWSEVSDKAADLGKIIRISRQNSSGTYAYFRKAVLGEGRDYKLGSVDLSGSKDVVAMVARTPGAIGYSGMGYATPEVKMLKIAKQDSPGVAPTVENAKGGTYPITRPLHIYTIGEPTGVVKEYIDWILSPAGQKVVVDLGYVPVD